MSSFQGSSSSKQEKRLLRNERDRERRRNETPQQREARLAKRRVKGGACRETCKEREQQLQRQQRLIVDRSRSRSRRQHETTPEKELRQSGDRARYQIRRESEVTPEEEQHEGDRCEAAPFIVEQQISPYDGMLKYHETLSCIKSFKCNACFENFPTLSVSRLPNGVSECSR
uniref:Uncharacterized protein n=1 Tax=Amphimedon queenslandica TaxID=400682 RepID=A0A1X7SZR2_AMPQE